MTAHRRYLVPVRPLHRETFNSYSDRLLRANHETSRHAATLSSTLSPSAKKADLDTAWRRIVTLKTGVKAEQFGPSSHGEFRHPDRTSCDHCLTSLPSTRTLCVLCAHGDTVSQSAHFDTLVCLKHRRWVGLTSPASAQHPASAEHLTAARQLRKLRRKSLVDPRLFTLLTTLITTTTGDNEYAAFPTVIATIRSISDIGFQRAFFAPTQKFENALNLLRSQLPTTPDRVIAGLWLHFRPTFHAVHTAAYAGTPYTPRWVHDFTIRTAARDTTTVDVYALDDFENHEAALTDAFPMLDRPKGIGLDRPSPTRPDTHRLLVCENGHEYERIRTQLTKPCPTCTQVATNRSLASRPNLAREYVRALNGGRKPEHIFFGSSEMLWWTCAQNHTWESTASNRSSARTGCPYCQNRRLMPGFNDLATTHPDIAAEWDLSVPSEHSPTTVSHGSNIPANWKCGLGHTYVMRVWDRVNGGFCPDCRKASVKEANLVETHPDLAAEWHHMNDHPASMYTHGSKHLAWWLCPKFHRYAQRIERRTTGRYNCGICSKRQLASGINDLQSSDPALATEYAIELNSRAANMVIASNLNFWWKCARNGHVHEQNVPNRRKSKGCPLCSPSERILYNGTHSELGIS